MPQSKLGNYIVNYHNSSEFHQLKTEIFTQDGYYFEVAAQRLKANRPLTIIDAGAHIGLATLYFKKLYPDAQIIALEPHPANFKLLETNIWENNLVDVQLYQLALSDYSGQLEIYSDTEFNWYSTAGVHSGAWNGDQKTQPLMVNCQPLINFLHQPVDLLKMDIEGHEQQVLLAAGDRIKQIDHLMIEFHPTPNQNLTALIDFLQKQNFTIKLWKNGQTVDLKHARGLVIIDAVHR